MRKFIAAAVLAVFARRRCRRCPIRPRRAEQELLLKKKKAAEAKRQAEKKKAAAAQKAAEEKKKKEALARKAAADRRRRSSRRARPRRRSRRLRSRPSARRPPSSASWPAATPCATACWNASSASRATAFSAPALPPRAAVRQTVRPRKWSPGAKAAKYAPGSIVVKTPERALYLVMGDGEARRYSVGVGREGFQWSGNSRIVEQGRNGRPGARRRR